MFIFFHDQNGIWADAIELLKLYMPDWDRAIPPNFHTNENKPETALLQLNEKLPSRYQLLERFNRPEPEPDDENGGWISDKGWIE